MQARFGTMALRARGATTVARQGLAGGRRLFSAQPARPTQTAMASPRGAASFSSSASSSSSSTTASPVLRRVGGAFAALGAAAGLAVFAGSGVALAEGAAAAAPAAADGSADVAGDAPAGGEAKPKRRKRIKRRRKQGWLDTDPLPYPGKFESMEQSTNEVLQPETWSGARIEYALMPCARSPVKEFAITHSIMMGAPPTQANPAGASYDFATHVAIGKTLLLARLSTDGRLHGRYHAQWSEAVSSRLAFDMVDTPGMSQGVLDIDIQGADSATQVKLGSAYGFSYLQSVTPTIALGAWAMYNPVVGKTATKWAAQQVSGDDTLVVAYSNMGVANASYAHKVDDVLTLATEVTVNTDTHESIAAVGYQYKFPNHSVFRGVVTTQGRIQGALDQILYGVLKFSLCGEVDHEHEQYAFGFGFSLG